MKHPTSLLRTATRRAKSDVANKLVSMFLHELSRKVSREWGVRVDSGEYSKLVESCFGSLCPYCSVDLHTVTPVVEHLDGLNRYRVGLHIPGNVLISCRRCNNEKRRDDSKLVLILQDTGWESFLSHTGGTCSATCPTCEYWRTVWPIEEERAQALQSNLARIRNFRKSFEHFDRTMTPLRAQLPEVLTKMYADCQLFAQSEITAMLDKFPQ
jgi:hypothetical protein